MLHDTCPTSTTLKMFATLSYKDTDDEIQVTPASSTYFNGGKPMRLACTECRAKKVEYLVFAALHLLTSDNV
jgi:hypothetical protein